MMYRVLATLLVVLGVTQARTPLDLLQVASRDFIGVFDETEGYDHEGIQTFWNQYTITDATPPTIDHPNLNGAKYTTTVEGKTMQTINNRTIYAFQGIRYGKPPTGDFRFKKTEPADPYPENDTVVANHLGNMCPQRGLLYHGPVGDEDCLFLNVYTPYLPDELEQKHNGTLLPVMLFIHGGAFISGDASLYTPTKLLDRDVILVVIHYRLGSLGFFSLDNDDAPGNAGLWDQITAMQWVKDNIEGFGGDSSRVTIFGESAGSASVNYHLIIEKSRGLFHGVIGESGSALEHWAHDPDPITSAIVIAEANKCSVSSLSEIYECMKTKSALDLAINMANFVEADRKSGGMGFKGASPVTQGPSVSDPLVTKDPKQSFKDHDMSDVPLMIGANKHEGSFIMGIMYNEYLVANNKTNDTEYLRTDMIDDILGAFGVVDTTGSIARSMTESYIRGTDLGDFEAASPGLIDMTGVMFLKAGAWKTALHHAEYTNKTFFYSFDFESDDTMFSWLFIGHSHVPFKQGVTHSDELMYLFAFPAVMEGQQIMVKDRMVRMWTNFAIYGDPTPDEDQASWKDLQIPKWKPLTTQEHNYMLIQDECTQESEYPNRWHIAYEEAQPATTTVSSTTTTSPTVNNCSDYDTIKNERQSFMITMIVFVVAFACVSALAGYLYFKSR
ncbi:hypothetical protein OTU49_014823 [Cherax quadricarinatus]|uniref:Carboxylic ester hydrolase n=1 Tax=Cherax quadricarinatus TaxID=27406 RepID=A0AAW0YF63_CHEQU